MDNPAAACPLMQMELDDPPMQTQIQWGVLHKLKIMDEVGEACCASDDSYGLWDGTERHNDDFDDYIFRPQRSAFNVWVRSFFLDEPDSEEEDPCDPRVESWMEAIDDLWANNFRFDLHIDWLLPTPSLLLLIAIALHLSGAIIISPALWITALAILAADGFSPLATPLNRFKGPSISFSPVGHLPDILDPDISPTTHEHWLKAYGKTIMHNGYGFADRRIMTFDPMAITQILSNTNIFHKTWQGKVYVDQAIGYGGMVFAEGWFHMLLRRLVHPVFQKSNVMALSHVTVQKAFELVDKFVQLHTDSACGPAGEFKLNVLPWLNRATFDNIGLSGFSYDFKAIQGDSDALYQCFTTLFKTIEGFSLRMYLGIYFPWLDRILPDARVKTIRRCRAMIHDFAQGWIRDRTAHLNGDKVDETKKLEGNAPDLLTLLIQENMKQADSGITDVEIVSQICTFLFAGMDTTSLAISWVLHYLSTHPSIQARLRTEVHSISIDPELPHFSEINALPFLDKVVKEALRLTPPVHSTMRVAMEDTVILLEKPQQLKNGQWTTTVEVPKGTIVFVPLEGLNKLIGIWGEDAHEFNPDRWDNLPDTVFDMLPTGAMDHMMSFSLGPKVCIGKHFAINEIKAFLFALIYHFMIGSYGTIVKRNTMLTRPIVDGENGVGPQLPLMFSLAPRPATTPPLRPRLDIPLAASSPDASSSSSAPSSMRSSLSPSPSFSSSTSDTSFSSSPSPSTPSTPPHIYSPIPLKHTDLPLPLSRPSSPSSSPSIPSFAAYPSFPTQFSDEQMEDFLLMMRQEIPALVPLPESRPGSPTLL